MRRIASIVVLGLLAAPACALGADRVIDPGRLGVKRIGSFVPRQDPTVGAAIRAFGSPSSRRPDDNVCVMRWRALGLQILFANFGGAAPGQTTCSRDVGRAQTFKATGRSFVSWRGLRVGARERRIPERHPAAVDKGRAWRLKAAVSPFGAGGTYSVVKAIVAGGRVRALAGWIGEAGE